MGKLKLTEKQINSRDMFLVKLKSGVYKEVANLCVCGVKRDVVIGNQDRYEIPLKTVLCMNCGLVRSNPYYIPTTVKSFYENEYRLLYTDSQKASNHFYTDQIRFGNAIVNYLKSSLDIRLDGKKVFEIGAGAGGILEVFKENGAKVFGCDYGNEYLEKGKKKGITLVQGDSRALGRYGKADLIVLNHVLEHFLNIKHELGYLRSLLKSNGYLYISVPGLLSHHKIYGSLRWYLQNAHYYSFTLDSLTFFMSLYGFERIYGDEQIRAIFVKNKDVRLAYSKKSTIFLKYLFYRFSYILPNIFDLLKIVRKMIISVVKMFKESSH